MRLSNVILLVVLSHVLGACGAVDCSGNSQMYSHECQKDPETTPQSNNYFAIQGSVVGAFGVDVDGQSYADIESFYTEERELLPAKIEDAGYVGYEVELKAKLGFKDLTSGMAVFVSANGKRGYAAKSTVNPDDTFSIRFPKDAAGDVYKIKATKRISILLKRDDELLVFCYNFSASDLDVPYDEVDKPIVLSSFKTNITSYACPQEDSDGISIPKNKNAPSDEDTQDDGSAPDELDESNQG